MHGIDRFFQYVEEKSYKIQYRVLSSRFRGKTTCPLCHGTRLRPDIYSCLGSPTPPEIEFSRKTPLNNGDVILLCTDGLWGVTAGEVMARSLKSANLLQAVPTMLFEAETKAGPRGDNLSVVAARWEDSYVEEPSSVISTQTMSQEEVSTHLDEFGRSPSYKTELSEDEIERAIREIRATIDKYTPKQ